MQKTKLSKRILIYLITLATITFASFLYARFSAAHSESFEVAKKFLSESPELSKTVGPINAIRLSWPGEFSIDEIEINGRRSGDAFFSIEIIGQSRNANVEVELQITSGLWTIKSGIMHLDDGRVIDLLLSDGK